MAKCCTYLRQGIGLVVVDVVTSPTANLHDELMHLMDFQALLRVCWADADLCRELPAGTPPGENTIDLWPATLDVGRTLPTMPLPLKGRGWLPLDLDATYETALEQSGT